MSRALGNGIAFSALVTLLFIVGCALTKTSLPTDAGGACASALTPEEFDSWFESGAVSLDGAVRPADSVNFPDVPNCSFYKWSEQMFLWLTSPAPPRYGGGGGLVMNSPAFFDVTLPDEDGRRQFVPHSSGAAPAFNLRTAQNGSLNLPVVMEKKTLRMLQILPPVIAPSGRQMVLDGDGNELEIGGARRGADGQPILLDTSGSEIRSPRAIMRSKTETAVKPFERILERMRTFDRSELVQKIALDEGFTLLDLFGHFTEVEQGQSDSGVLMAQNGSLVYYTLTVNKVFVLYRSMQDEPVAADTKFPVTQSDLDAILSFAEDNGHGPVIDAEALAIELKASWVEAEGLIDADQFIQVKATVPTYDKSDPAEWVPNGKKTVMLAMVGLHVVGSTGSLSSSNANQGHPEMLWATFEHVSNGPAVEYSYTKASGGTGTVPQDTTGNWVFCANGSSGPFNEMRMKMGDPDKDHIVAIDGNSMGPSDILRMKPWGMDGSSATSNAQILSLNDTVRSLLHQGDVRRNYFHEGTTWTIHGASPTPSNQVGTKKLANTTMETFVQGTNCFTCHTSNTTAVSFVFNETDPLF